jgi:hypothetical protein
VVVLLRCHSRCSVVLTLWADQANRADLDGCEGQLLQVRPYFAWVKFLGAIDECCFCCRCGCVDFEALTWTAARGSCCRWGCYKLYPALYPALQLLLQLLHCRLLTWAAARGSCSSEDDNFVPCIAIFAAAALSLALISSAVLMLCQLCCTLI